MGVAVAVPTAMGVAVAVAVAVLAVVLTVAVAWLAPSSSQCCGVWGEGHEGCGGGGGWVSG